MKSKILQFSLFVFGLALMASAAANAQKLLEYSIEKLYDQPYQSIEGTGNLLAQNIYGWSYWWLYEYDARLGGFQFRYDDRMWNRFGISGGGYIALFNNTMPFPYTCGQYSYPYTWICYYFYDAHTIYNNMCANRPALYPMYAYYGSYYTATYPGRIYFEVRGAAPSRTLIIEWNNVSPYDANSWPSQSYRNFQVWMHEGGVVEYKYGPMYYSSNYSYDYYYYPPYWYGYAWYTVGFTGCDWVTSKDGLYSYYSYINIYSREDGQEMVPHFSDRNYLPFYATPAIRDISTGFPTASDVAAIRPGLVIKASAYPSLVSADPYKGQILRKGNVYTGSNHPGIWVERSGGPEVSVKFNIGGPLPKTMPDYRDIYTAHKVGNPNDLVYLMQEQPVGKPGKGRILTAKGIAAGTNGALDLQTNQNQIIGGEYVVEAEMILIRNGQVFYSSKLPSHTFIIALDNDIALSQLLSPITREDKKYPLGSSVPMQCRVMNVGINSVAEFETTLRIYKNNTLIQTYTNTWRNTQTPLTTGQYANIVFPNYTPTDIGDFEVTVTTALRGATDQNLANNIFPRSNMPEFFFNVAHEVDGIALEILTPIGQVPLNRPFIPVAKFGNNGVSDMSDIPATCIITDPAGNEVYRSDIIIEDISTGKFNTKIVDFRNNFIPTIAGNYTICVSINSDDDPLITNNQICGSFSAIEGMSGLYTIGTLNSGQARNFATFQAAANALFTNGITGSVVFELTDATYEVGALQGQPGYVANAPALDLSSMIIGADQVRTITFKPSRSRMVTRGGITINLNSETGVGILFGQNATPTNSNSPVLGVQRGLIRKYANSAGYITFDGGSYKALRFRLNTESPFQAPFYLAEGAENITISNCIIESLTPVNSLRHATLPLTVFDPSQEKYRFEQNQRSATNTYSAGILLRSIAPVLKQNVANPDLNTNSFNLDTIPNRNNKIIGNDISGFGFGIVSLGIGPMLDFGKNEIVPYYNNNNLIANNDIYKVARAGIFAGFENGSIIKNNRIYDVTGIYQTNTWVAGAAGIMAGGEAKTNWSGYNNMNLTITGNEISQIASNSVAQGIRVQQYRIPLTQPGKGIVYFPNVDENTTITNNVVWGLAPTNTSASKVGIYLLTERKNMNVYVPFDASYFTKGDKIANNTIYVSEDGIGNSGIVAGIGIQNSYGVKVYNNALAMLDETFDKSADAASLICFQGIDPEFHGIHSDRNAFWVSSSNAGIYRYIQIDENSSILEQGHRNEFMNLGQWQQWTGQEMHSVYGNFTGDLAFSGINPMNLRVITSPQTPIGSLLNNRGDRLSWVTNDIDGNTRGEAGQRFDIGACEFNGRQYLEDIEVEGIFAPGAYQASDGIFSDAEYIMTKAPVEVIARLRNNSSLLRSNIEVTVRIYRELPSGVFDPTPVLTETAMINIQPNESSEAIFRLADGQGAEFYPETYGDLHNAGFNVPLEFQSMKPNVTPKYRIIVSIGYDQFNSNNNYSKIVRFYLKRSSMDMLVSAEHSNKTIASGTPTIDHIAGRLNFNNLIDGLDKLGWYIDFDTEPPRYDFDVFERTGWEPKSVNYSLYRSMFWTDGNDKPLSRYEREDIRKYFNSGNETTKKNLIIGSQEIVRETAPLDARFVNNLLRVDHVAPGNPQGKGVSNDGNKVIGVAIAYNRSESIKATGFTLNTPTGDINDADPYCGLIKPFPQGEGLSRIGYRYQKHVGAPNDSAMGVALTTITKNVITLGVDWRHFANISLLLSGVLDFIDANGGNIIAAELLEFNAMQSGEKVEVTWATASELNSARFDVERAEVQDNGRTEFAKIEELQAAGNSSSLRNYGPVIDRGVALGNTYVYRLKMVDKDGSFEYSQERTVTMTGDGIVRLEKAMPNPARDFAVIGYSLIESTNLKIALYDATGKLVKSLFDAIQRAGNNEIRIDVKDLPSGSYTVAFTAGNVTLTRNLTVTK